MSPPSLDLSRAIALDGVTIPGAAIVTPDSPDVARALAYLTVAASSPLSIAEARSRVSIYLPELVDDVQDVLALVWSAAPRPLTAPALILSDGAWGGAQDDGAPGATLAGVLAHELGHRRRDLATRASTQPLPVIGSALWATTYLVHAPVRGWDEGTCYTSDMQADVILRGASVGDAFARAKEALRSPIYRLDAITERVGLDALRSCADSLERGVLHGEDTPMHAVLRALVARGWDAGPWAAAIGGERPTTEPS